MNDPELKAVPAITDEMFAAYRGALKAYIDALPDYERKPGHRGLILNERLKAALRWHAMLAASPPQAGCQAAEAMTLLGETLNFAQWQSLSEADRRKALWKVYRLLTEAAEEQVQPVAGDEGAICKHGTRHPHECRECFMEGWPPPPPADLKAEAVAYRWRWTETSSQLGWGVSIDDPTARLRRYEWPFEVEPAYPLSALSAAHAAGKAEGEAARAFPGQSAIADVVREFADRIGEDRIIMFERRLAGLFLSAYGAGKVDAEEQRKRFAEMAEARARLLDGSG